jgi:hypothetical protein
MATFVHTPSRRTVAVGVTAARSRSAAAAIRRSAEVDAGADERDRDDDRGVDTLSNDAAMGLAVRRTATSGFANRWAT